MKSWWPVAEGSWFAPAEGLVPPPARTGKGDMGETEGGRGRVGDRGVRREESEYRAGERDVEV